MTTLAQPRLIGADALKTAGFVLGSIALAAALISGPIALVMVAIVCAPYAYFNPKTGLWLSLAVIMLASLIAPPAGFEFGVGDSPELRYWAVAGCCLFVALGLKYILKNEKSKENSERDSMPSPLAFRCFMAVTLFSATLGLLHRYPLQNVAKQFYGCLLFCAYFLFALRFTPREEDVHSTTDAIKKAGIFFALIYIAYYLYRLPALGIHKELTILSAYAGGLAVLYLPAWLEHKKALRNVGILLPMLALFAVPLLGQYKRAILAFVVCGFLLVGLRAVSRWKRYVWTLLAFLLFTVAIATDALNPLGEYFSQYPSVSMLFPQDIQSSYSVYLRVEEVKQAWDSFGVVPVVGTGLGSTIVWFDPYARVWWEQETIDVGWGYLIIKMGIIGTAAFLWLMWKLASGALRKPLRGLHLGLFLLLIYQLLQMVADPLPFNFMTAAWAGMTAGSLYILNQQRRHNNVEFPVLAI